MFIHAFTTPLLLLFALNGGFHPSPTLEPSVRRVQRDARRSCPSTRLPSEGRSLRRDFQRLQYSNAGGVGMTKAATALIFSSPQFNPISIFNNQWESSIGPANDELTCATNPSSTPNRSNLE